MANRDPERLGNYLKLITKRRGGVEGVLSVVEAAQAEAVQGGGGPGSGLEVMAAPALPDLGLEGLRTMSLGGEPTEAETAGLEAIIYADLRPAVDVREGRFSITHPLWKHLSDTPAVRERIEAAIPSIGRIELPGHPRIPYGGTGFVVGNGLVMTNRHVAALFASGLGDRNVGFVSGGRAGIDFLRERDQPPGPTFKVRRVVMIHPYWDMAILEVEGLPQKSALQLSLSDARDLAGREIFVVGYPAFDPRNPSAVQQDLFRGEYGIKRLQPGELHSGKTTGSFGKMVAAATHDCSTLGGNSGSAVVDVDTGQVLALHFGGVYQEQNFCVPSFEMARDQRIVDAGVEFGGTPSGGPNGWSEWWTRADTDEAAAPGAPEPRPRTAADAPASVQARPSVPVSGGGTVSVEIPLRITISLGEPHVAAQPAERREGVTETATEGLAEPSHDGDYTNRRGYDPGFLDPGDDVPMPDAADQAVLARTKAGGSVLHYQNFSIRMHAARRLALVCAWNATKSDDLRRPEKGRDYTRRGLTGLGKNDQERWFADPRLDERCQLPDAFFTKDRKAFDKGHIVRRDDVAWGKTYDELRRANGDSFHVTNCSPQVAGFNRSTLGESNWGDLENHVLAEATSERLCVFAGPVLDPADEVFVGVGDGRSTLRAKIPARYWKVIVARLDEGIAAFGFVLEQDLSDVQWEFAVPAEFAPALASLEEIERMTGVSFGAKVLAADQFGTPRGDEIGLRGGARLRRPKAGGDVPAPA